MKLYFEELTNKKVNTLYYIYKSEEDAKDDEIDPLYIFSDKSKADLAKENGYYVDVVTDKDCLALYENKKRMNEAFDRDLAIQLFKDVLENNFSQHRTKRAKDMPMGLYLEFKIAFDKAFDEFMSGSTNWT